MSLDIIPQIFLFFDKLEPRDSYQKNSSKNKDVADKSFKHLVKVKGTNGKMLQR